MALRLFSLRFQHCAHSSSSSLSIVFATMWVGCAASLPRFGRHPRSTTMRRALRLQTNDRAMCVSSSGVISCDIVSRSRRGMLRGTARHHSG